MKLDSIYDSMYQDQITKDPQEFISRIEPNIPDIEGFDKRDQEEYKKATRLISDYALMLFKTGTYSKSIPWLNKGILLFENDSGLKEITFFTEPMYEALIASRGVCMFKFKRFNKAQEDFGRLLSVNPENENYRQWLLKSKGKQFQRLAIPFYILILVGIVVSLSIGEAKGLVSFTAMGSIAVGLIGSSVFEYLKRKNRNAA